MKNTTLKIAAVVLLLILMPLLEAERVNLTTDAGGFITITPGTPIRLHVSPGNAPYYMDRLMIQIRPTAGTPGVVYVMLGVPINQTCSASNARHLSATLTPATATSPGGSLSDPQGAPGTTVPNAEDLNLACVDGTQADTITVTGWHRN